MIRRPPRSTLFPTRRSSDLFVLVERLDAQIVSVLVPILSLKRLDRKSTRLNSSHYSISYAVFCLQKKRSAGRRRPVPARSRPVPRPPLSPTARPAPPSRFFFKGCGDPGDLPPSPPGPSSD